MDGQRKRTRPVGVERHRGESTGVGLTLRAVPVAAAVVRDGWTVATVDALTASTVTQRLAALRFFYTQTIS